MNLPFIVNIRNQQLISKYITTWKSDFGYGAAPLSSVDGDAIPVSII